MFGQKQVTVLLCLYFGRNQREIVRRFRLEGATSMVFLGRWVDG
jgi:hypothetical protein